MNGTVSQLITLASAANGVISGRYNSESFYPTHTDFKFCDSVIFVDIWKDRLEKIREDIRHNDPSHWLEHLVANGGTQVWLTYTAETEPAAPEHQLAAFVGGGGKWQLVVSMTDIIEFWVPRWQVIDQNAHDDRIWKVTYIRVNKSIGLIKVPQTDLDTANSRLLNALNDINEFAKKHSLTFWADLFMRASNCLDESQPITFPDHIDFVCLDSYPEISQRLFAAAYLGWVFGGMGSWNDQSFKPKTENDLYNTLTGNLYSEITNAIQQATWSFNLSDAA